MTVERLDGYGFLSGNGIYSVRPRITSDATGQSFDRIQRITMLIYLDANLVQYCADYEDFIFEGSDVPPVNDPKLLRELEGLQQIVELEQLGEGWHAGAPKHLMRELLCEPTDNQRRVYYTLWQAWKEAAQQEAHDLGEETITQIEQSLRPLHLKDKDRRHLAEAIGLGAVWFLTNDKRLINHTRTPECPNLICNVQGVYVARASECIPEICKGLFLNTVQSD